MKLIPLVLIGAVLYTLWPKDTYKTVMVQPRQTLWSIAQQAEPDHDTRNVVYQIEKVNGLTSPVIQPGQVLKVPVEKGGGAK